MLGLHKVEDTTKTLIVTGGSSGIGKEFIKQYCKFNKNLLVCNLSRTEPEFSENFYNLVHFEADFTNSAGFAKARNALVQYISKHHAGGEIMLVNNSGFGSFGFFNEDDADRDSAMIDVNVKAPMLMTASLFPLLKEHGGTVVNISSTASYQPTPYFITYGASKAFLTNWSLGLWRECMNTPVKVVTICPGPTSTEFFDNAGLKASPGDGRTMHVNELVKKIIKAIHRGQPLMVGGFMNRIIASFAGVLPGTWITRIAYRAIGSQKLRK